ncbi:glycosyltransferase family 4 protein, partial [Patescibacteria group bacterium]|nr:glycosyltransferase family 4 protein [Patescibacteria group bacterium]
MDEKNGLLIISSKSSDYGGVEYHCLDLIRGFSKKYKVTIMCPYGALCQEYTLNGATVVNKIPKVPFDFSFALYVKKYCSENNITIVHGHELISAQGMLGAYLAKVPKRVWHVHTPFLFWKNSNIFQDFFKKTVNFITNFFVANFFATNVIALTEDIKKHRTYCEWVFNKITVIPNGVDYTKYSLRISKEEIENFKIQNKIPLNKIIIGNISRTSAEKGQIFLCEAFKLLKEKSPNKYFLLIAGGGELESELRTYCGNNFENDFLITGKFEESEKFKILQSMNFFVFPSTAEGFGYTPIEAVYSKILVISS